MKLTGLPFEAETPSNVCHWVLFWSSLRYGSAKMIHCIESHFTLLMLLGSHYCVPAWRPLPPQIIVFFTHQTSCGSTSVALWKWWTWRQGAASVCHTGPLCHTLVGQWYRNREGTACGRVFRRGATSVLGTCSSSAETPSGSASNSVRTSLSCMGPKWYSQCIPHTSRGSWHQAGICGGQQKTSVKPKKAGCSKLQSRQIYQNISDKVFYKPSKLSLPRLHDWR